LGGQKPKFNHQITYSHTLRGGILKKMENKKYNIIYADPPWKYDFSKDNSDRVENHYPTMTLEEIKFLKLPIEDNAVLFLWATAPKLIEALEVMKAWGFTYKTNMVWNKDWIGMGYWFRGNHELLLVGVKGKFSPPAFENRVNSVFTEKRTTHSKKPDYFRELITRMFQEGRKIELFAREKKDGWDCFGNEVKSDIELNSEGKFFSPQA